MKYGFSAYYEAKKVREASLDRLFNETVKKAEQSIDKSIMLGKYSACVEISGCPSWLKEELTKRICEFFDEWNYEIEWTEPNTFVLYYEQEGE